jgi:hypothetical protein
MRESDEPSLQLVAQRSDAPPPHRRIFSTARGFRESCGGDRVDCSGTQSTLLSAAEQYRRQRQARTCHEGSDRLRAPHLVTGEAPGIRAGDAVVHATERLHGVDVDAHARSTRPSDDVMDRLNDSGLRVDRLQRNEPNVGERNRAIEVVEGERPIGSDVYPSNPCPAFSFESLGNARNRRVLEAARHENSGRMSKGAAYGQVVGLRTARSQDDVARVTKREPGYCLPRILDACARSTAEMVNTGWVAPLLASRDPHDVDDRRRRRRGSVPVQIDALHALTTTVGACFATVSKNAAPAR